MKLTQIGLLIAAVTSVLFVVACGSGNGADAPAVAVKGIASTNTPEPTSVPDAVSPQSPTPPPISMVLETVSPELLSCVQTALGDEQYNAIISGRQDAVAEQLGIVLPCIMQYPQEANAIMEMFGLDMGAIMAASTPIPNTQNPSPTNTVVPKPTNTPTLAPTATSVPTLYPTPTNTPTVAPMPTATPTPIPTKTPMPPANSTDSNYTLIVDQGQESWSGKTVTFRVGGNQAGETAFWVQGGSMYLDLTAYSGYSKAFSEIYSNTRISFLAQRVPPHVFVGTAYLDGVPASGGTAVSAWIDGVLEAETVVHETVASNLNNSASATFSVLVDNGSLEIVWEFSNASKSWRFFDPSVGLLAASTLTDVTPGDIMWVNVSSEQSFQSGILFPGWNLISLD